MNDTTTTLRTADPVMAEVWRIKGEIAAEHAYDVRRIAAAAIAAQKRHADRVVDMTRRKAESGGR